MSPVTNRMPAGRLLAQRGFTMIELMIGLAIGAVILVGTVLVFQQSRASFVVTEAIARLQENARFALDILEPDIRHASYWGLSNHAEFIDARRGTPAQLPALAGDCGDRWYIDLDNTLPGINGTSVIGGINATNTPMLACIPDANYQPETDILVVRHASEQSVLPQAGRVQIQSDPLNGILFTGAAIPGGFAAPPASESFDLISHGYYVSPDSSALGPGIPSLRRVTLISGPAVEDQEIIPGVEDLQLQFGVDTDGDLDANRYINADNAMIVPGSPGFDPDLQIVSVRIWLRFRAIRIENGHIDDLGYQYADINQAAPNDSFRRLVISKTIQLRNTRSQT